MRVTSTLRIDRLYAALIRSNPPKYDRNADLQTGRAACFTRSLPGGKTGIDVTSPSPVCPSPNRLDRLADGPCFAPMKPGRPGEPPDKSIPSRSHAANHTSSLVSTSLQQHRMNDQLLLVKSPHDSTVCYRPEVVDRHLSVVWERLSLSNDRSLFGQALRMMCVTLAFVFGLVVFSARAQSPSALPIIDLSVHKAVSNQNPTIGSVLTYTVVVANSKSSIRATGVVVKDELPAEGVAYVPGSATVVRGSGTYIPATGIWNVGAVLPNDSSVLVLKATVLGRGVYFNTAEVIAADQSDSDSTPNNKSLVEDDYDAVCFSVPIFWYPGDEYTVTLPSGYDRIVWYRNDEPITAPAVSSSLAVVNADLSLTFKSPGTYRFQTYVNGCPASSCCAIEVLQGPYGSLGDLVFNDFNKNGRQDSGDIGIDGVKVYLYDETGTTKLDSAITARGGLYKFDSLTDGNYTVKFIAPSGFLSSLANAAGVADNVDSDAGVNGLTAVYTIDTSQPEASIARNNPTVDAGYYLQEVPKASLGDKVFADTNKDGLQGAGEPGIPGVVVVLLDGNLSPIASTTTNASGIYSFTGLTVGVPYSVSFVTPTGYVSTNVNVGPNDAIDSDVDPLTGRTTQTYTLTANENNTSVDAGYYLQEVPKASLGDFVFLDNDGNGQQGGFGESGVSGIKVTLYASGSSTPVSTTTTGSDGKYLFTNLTPGVGYYVVFDTTGLRARNLMITFANQGPDATDSDADETGKTGVYVLAPGEVNLTADAGLKAFCPTNFSLVASADATICIGQPTQLVASTPVQNAKINWYLTPFDGVAFASVASGVSVPVDPSSTTIYYAEAVAPNGCVSARKPVVITVTALPTPVLVSNIKNDCPTRTVDLTKIQIQNQSSNLTYEWYTSIDRASASLIANPTAVGAGRVYLFAKSANGCYSSPAVVTVEIVDCNCQNVAGVSAGPGLNICAGDAVPVKAVLSGSATSVIWTSSGTGTFTSATSLSTTYSPSPSDVATGGVILTVTTNDPDGPGGICQPGTSSLILKINTRPGTPVGVACDDTLVCQGSSTKLIGFAPGYRINWYDQNNQLIGTTESGAKLVITPSKAGSNVYTAEAVSAQTCVSSRASVTVLVGSCLADLAVLKQVVTAGPYSVGQKITYSIMASNNGPITGTSVIVKDILPATLTYLSSTPVGQYNVGTGIWTVGTLTAGSNRSLLVEATINAAGSIKNTAIIGGPNNDPKYPQNDTSSVTIETNRCFVKAPVIASTRTEICLDGSTVLRATGCDGGTVKWSDGQTGLEVTVSPKVTTSYSASCTINGCTSEGASPILIKVISVTTPTLTASAATVCPGGSVTLTAGGCENGVIEWSERDQTGASIVVMPFSKTTYTAQCRVGTCLSNVASKTIDIATDLPTPTITTSATAVCPGETVTLTVAGCSGTPVWSNSSLTTTSIVVTPTVGNNTYSVYCKAGSCASKPSATLTINLASPMIPTVTASADSICLKGVVSLTATGCSGTVVWNATDRNGVNLTGSVISVSPDASTSYYARCKTQSCLSERSTAVPVTVLNPSAPIVRSDKSLVCSGEKVTLTAEGCAGTVKWYGIDKVGASIEIFPGESKEYYATCKQASCESEPSNRIRITIKTSGTAPRIVASATSACNGGVVSLTAIGCSESVIWSDGQTGAVVSVTVTPTNTEFYAMCKSSTECGSPKSNVININVTPLPTVTLTASAATVCPGGSVTLTAGGCENGVIEWSERDQTGASIVVMPFSKTTYTAQCRVGTCLSNVASKTIDIATDLPTPTITTSATAVCPGETVTLTVAGCSGTPVWSNSSLTTTSIVVTPTVGNNTYSVYCKAGSCASKPSATLTINLASPTIPSVTASADSICLKGVVSLTATGCSGTVVWNATDRNGVNLTGSVISVSPDASTSYYAQCKSGTCVSDRSRAVQVTVLNPSAPIVRSDKSLVCSGEKVTLTAEGCAGTVKWYGIDKVGASIEIFPGESKEYYATCKQASCESEPSNRIRITIKTSGTAPRIVASATSACNGGVVSLTAIGCSESVIWSDGQTGAVVSVTVTPTNTEFYAMCKSSTECGSPRSNVINISLTPLPTPTVTSSTTSICPGNSVMLTVANCQGTPYWSTKETTKSITVSPLVTTSYSVYCQDGVCKSTSSAQYTITVVPVAAPTIVASATTVEPGGTITLTATGCAGEVIWSDNDINGKNTGAVIVVRPVGTQTYYAQCKVQSCTSDPSITITVNKGDCLAKAGTLASVKPTVCADSSKTLVISATPGSGLVKPTGYSVVYVLTKGAGLVVQQTGATPSFTVPAAAAAYTIHTLIYNANPADKNYLDLSLVKVGITTGADVLKLIADKKVCADLDVAGAKVTVKYVEPPVLSVSSQTVCSGTSVTFSSLSCEAGVLQWSDGTIGHTITKVIYSDLYMTATCTIDGCTSKAAAGVKVTVGEPGIPTLVSDKPSICLGETVTLTATGCQGGTFIWSDNKTTGNVLTINPTAEVSYRVKCKVGTCESSWSPYTIIKVGAPNAPTITVVGSGTALVSSTTVCFGSPVTLIAQGCSPNSYVTWSNDLVGTSITVSLAASGTYTARCCTSVSCKSAPSNPIAITVLPKVVQPQTVDRVNTCPFVTVDLATGVTGRASTTGGIFEYYATATLSPDSKVANPAAVGNGTYYVVEKTINGCYSLPALIHVRITPCNEVTPCDPQNPAQANAGADAAICAAKAYQLSGMMGGAGKVAQWKTSGTGTFSDPFIVNPIYTASAADILAGKVTLMLSVSTNNATCPVAKDEMVLTIESSKVVPTVTVRGATNFCYGDSVTLVSSVGSGYLWSNGAKTQQIVVKNSGTFSVQLLDLTGCSSMPSADVVVQVAQPTPVPVVSTLRNDCPSAVVNLTKAVSQTVVGTTYEYRIGPLLSSAIVMRPDSVGAGIYYIFGKSTIGCVSAPAKVTVNIFNCRTDSLKTDLELVKTVNKTTVKVGETVNYTLKVKNLGPNVATNIEVHDDLPKGVEFVASSTKAYEFAGGTIIWRINKLLVGKSDSVTFSVRVLETGPILNMADIKYLDQQDTDIVNDWANVTIMSTSDKKASLIGLAKSVIGMPTAVGDSLIRVTYGFVVTNYGADTLRKVQVSDDLAAVFAPNTILSAVITPKTLGSTLVANPAFTGSGTNIQLLSQTSYLAPGRSQVLILDLVVKRAVGDTTRTFRNQATATAQNSLTTVTDKSASGGDADPDDDNDPTNNNGYTIFMLGEKPLAGPAIGVALAVAKVEKQDDGVYLITYKATIKNTGDAPLSGISLTDSLIRVFAAPTSYTVVGPPVVAPGSSLVANAMFNGNAQSNLLTSASKLGVGEQDTLLVTVRIATNNNNGPFFSSATATAIATASGQVVKDISNNGFDPVKPGAVSTPVRFDLPKGLVGVAKSVGTPTLVEPGVYDISYSIKVSNLGAVPLKKVQVVDDLSKAFGHGALIVSNRIAVSAKPGLTVDPLYTGQGLITKMLIDSLSTLPVGASNTLTFTVRVNVKNADSLTFYNTAKVTALTADNALVEDMSTAGINDDPDNDLDPRNNSMPTPVSLNSETLNAYLGIAMAVRDTIRQADGSFNVTYQVVLKNYGRDLLTNVSVTDSLSKVFNSTTGASYTIVKAPFTSSTGSALVLNSKFDGSTDARIVLGDSISMLAAGKVDTVLFTLNISTDGSTTTFLNSAVAQAKSGTVVVSDISTSGLDPDLNGNNNPTDLNEREATPLNLPATSTVLFIPQGFSPNNDGINDLFVIRGVGGLTISLEVYNRWGHMVYRNDTYKNDWDGKPNTGITINDGANGLPDGTYYYVIKTSDGRKFVRYMTINR